LLLARALLVGAGVLLLDEPAEHLDPQTADALVHDILTGTAHHGDDGAAATAIPAPATAPAVVVVTHRLAPLAAADEILVLEDGRIVARGTHTWLLERSLTYRDAVQAEQGLGPAPVQA
jgi:ATP-binding cassette subfamily C protein CydC